MNRPAPPGKEERRGEAALKTDSTRHNMPYVVAAQAECEHSETRVEILAPGSVHFGKEICRNCDRVLRWVPKAASIERRSMYAFRITKLLMSFGLTSWERNFLQSVAGRRRLSPRQTAVIDKLCEKFQIGTRR